MAGPDRQGRRPNRRGEGSLLRGEIVAGAAALLEETGNEDAVTLRGVARRVGIAAPSIYGHFSDVGEILDAVVAGAFEELDTALAEAAATDERGGGRGGPLLSVARAYVRFALERPHRYRVMFGRHRADPTAPPNRPRPIEELSGARAFQRLVSAVQVHLAPAAREGDPPVAPSGPRPDTVGTATALWVALHGYASLRASVPAFPWPPHDLLVETLVEGLVPKE